MTSRAVQSEAEIEDAVTLLLRSANAPEATYTQDQSSIHSTLRAAGLPRIAGYQVIRQLGHGGMGIVYLAHEADLNRDVALKVVVGGAFADLDLRQRFQREAEAIARLQHPNIVQIFRVGASDGGDAGAPPSPFIALEYVNGGTLSAHTGRAMKPQAAARIVATLARAIQYAHDRGIVHRDLKPGNVLMQPVAVPDATSELIDCLVPKVTDFGLAKQLDVGDAVRQGSSHTVAGSMLGTPEYMSPEQAGGKADVGRSADVYALGVILYELLTGRVPFQGADALDTLMLVRAHEPVSPRRLQTRLPQDLDTICIRCLQKEPNRRYASAAALADDLQRWLDHEPIAARPISALERTWKWARRRPAVASLLATVLFLAITGFAGVYSQWQRAEGRAIAERLAHGRAETALGEAEANLYFGRVNLALSELKSGNVWDASVLLDASVPAPGAKDRRSWEWHYLKNASRGEKLSFQASSDWVWDIAYSPDGRWLATAAGTPYFPDAESSTGELTLWDAATGHQVRQFLGHAGTVRRLAFSPDGRYLCSAGYDKTCRVWAVATGEPVGEPSPCQVEHHPFRAVFGDAGPIYFEPDSHSVVVRGPDGWYRRTISNGEITPLPGYAGMLELSRDARFAVSHREHSDVDVLDLTTMKPRTKVEKYDHVDRAALSPDGRYLLLSHGHLMEQFDLPSGQRRRVFEGMKAYIEGVAISRDSDRVAAAGADRTVLLFHQKRPFHIAFAGHEAEIRAVAFSPSGDRLASCDRTGRVFVWDTNHNPLQQIISSGSDASHTWAVGLTADGTHVLAIVAGQLLGRFDRAGTRVAELHLHGMTKQMLYPRLDVRFDADGSSAFAPLAADHRKVGQWSATTGELIREFSGHRFPVGAVAISADGRRLATRASLKLVDAGQRETWIWDLETGEKLREVTSESLVAIALSSDGRLLAGVNLVGVAIVFDATTGRELWRQRAHGTGDEAQVIVFGLAFSPDDQLLATAGFEDGLVRLWDATTGRAQSPGMGMHAPLTGVVFTPDGKRVAVAGYDSEVRLWDVATGQLALVLSPPTGARRGDSAHTARPVFSRRHQQLALLDWRGFIGWWDGRAGE